MMPISSLLRGLKERKLVQWALAYLAGGFVALQILDAVAEPLSLSIVAQRSILVGLAFGLVLTLVLAWYHGEKGRQRVGGVELIIVAVVLILAGTVLATMGRARPETGARPAVGAEYDRTAIAVLPFQDLGTSAVFGYFAAGLHDVLLTQLAKVSSLSLRGRTTVSAYAGTKRPIGEIAREMGVGTVVEGSVQIVGLSLRVNVQLIDAATDEHLWAEYYDRTLDDAFAVQSDIAQKIAAAVGAALSGSEARAIATPPTDNPEAYRLYLQGLEAFRRPGYLRGDLERAEEYFERAVAIDSTFALALAALSEVHGRMSAFRFDPSPARLMRQRVAAEAALRLDRDLPQAHVAMGFVHYVGRMDFERALEEYRIALEGMPNDANLWAMIGYGYRRIGEWDRALTAFDRVVSLDPGNAGVLEDLGANTLRFLRRYGDALRWYRRAAELDPSGGGSDLEQGWTWVLWQGRLDSLKAALDRYPPELDLGGLGSVNAWRAQALLWERKPDRVIELVGRSPEAIYDSQIFYLPTELFAAWAYQLREDTAAARHAYEKALMLIDSVADDLRDDWRVHAARGLALSGLGRRSEAEREANWLGESQTYRHDAFSRSNVAENRARILAGIGQVEAALSEIEGLLAGPSEFSVYNLRLDPLFDLIRPDPRFLAMLEKYAGQ